jgi:hypothetical protein
MKMPGSLMEGHNILLGFSTAGTVRRDSSNLVEILPRRNSVARQLSWGSASHLRGLISGDFRSSVFEAVVECFKAVHLDPQGRQTL